MTKKRELSLCILPAIFLWIANALHIIFTWWAIAVGGSGMEMAVLFPLCFIQLPALILILAAVICMVIARDDRGMVIKNLIPLVIFVLQVVTFWFFAFSF